MSYMRLDMIIAVLIVPLSSYTNDFVTLNHIWPEIIRQTYRTNNSLDTQISHK